MTACLPWLTALKELSTSILKLRFLLNCSEERKRRIRRRAELEQLKGLDNVTSDGRRINIYANIGSVEDVEKVLQSDAGGIGLFRSEFIYLGREDYPTEEEQFEIYKEVSFSEWAEEGNHQDAGHRSG